MSKQLLISNIKTLLTTIINGVLSSENQRISLYKTNNFNYMLLCYSIDKHKTGLITPKNLSQFFTAHSLNIPQSLITTLITHYSKYSTTQDCFLTYDNFIQLLLPKTIIVYDSTSLQQPSESDSLMLFEHEELACKILFNEFSLINVISQCLDSFYQDNSFVVYDIVKEFNNGNESEYITESNLETFCKRYNIEISHNEMKVLLYYLRADNERRISYYNLKNLFKYFVIKGDYLANNMFDKNNNVIGSFYKQMNMPVKKIGVVYDQIGLCEFLVTVMQYEKILYNAKMKIFCNDEIIPIELFYVFDTSDSNVISKKQFKDVLYHYFGISATNEEINIVFHRYVNEDVNENEMVFDEFKKMLLPYDQLKGNKLPNVQNYNIDNEEEMVSQHSKGMLIEFFKVLLTLEAKIERTKLRFVNDKNFSPYEQFLMLKGIENKYITKVDKRMLYNYMIENCKGGSNVDNEGLGSLFNRLDNDEDMLISYDDFAFAISPIINYSV